MRSRLEESAGGKIGRRDLGNRLAGAIGDQHDIGRRGQRAKIGDAAGKVVGHARRGEFLPPRRARLRGESGDSAPSSAAVTAAMPSR